MSRDAAWCRPSRSERRLERERGESSLMRSRLFAWRTRAGALAVAVFMLLPVPALTASPGRTLHGKTTFTATTTSRATISLPRPLTLFEDLDIRVDGDGRIFGFMMSKTGSYEQEAQRPVMVGLTTGQCDRRACEARDGFLFISAFNTGRKLSGTWNLYVVADGAPVDVTFTIKGESGRQTIPVAGHVKAEIRTLRPTVHETNSNAVYSAGDFTELDRVDFGMVGLWTVGQPHGATAYGSCAYEGDGAPPVEDAFLPGCPAGDGYENVSSAPGPGGGIVLTAGTYGRTRGLGGWYATASAVERYGAVGFWIDL